MGFEETNLTGVANLFERFMDDTPHVTFVILVGTEDVEEFESHNPILQPHAKDPEVKELF